MQIVDRLERGGGDGEEGGGYRVCYHTRDFPLGGVVLRSIQQAIEHSKRVVCLLSGGKCISSHHATNTVSESHRMHRTQGRGLLLPMWPGLSVYLPAGHNREPASPTKAAEPIEMKFGIWTRVGPSNHVRIPPDVFALRWSP